MLALGQGQKWECFFHMKSQVSDKKPRPVFKWIISSSIPFCDHYSYGRFEGSLFLERSSSIRGPLSTEDVYQIQPPGRAYCMFLTNVLTFPHSSCNRSQHFMSQELFLSICKC